MSIIRHVLIDGRNMLSFLPGQIGVSLVTLAQSYNADHAVSKYGRASPEMRWLEALTQKLDGRIYFGRTQIERCLAWCEYGLVVWQNCDDSDSERIQTRISH